MLHEHPEVVVPAILQALLSKVTLFDDWGSTASDIETGVRK
jgi:hypothetical protein